MESHSFNVHVIYVILLVYFIYQHSSAATAPAPDDSVIQPQQYDELESSGSDYDFRDDDVFSGSYQSPIDVTLALKRQRQFNWPSAVGHSLTSSRTTGNNNNDKGAEPTSSLGSGGTSSVRERKVKKAGRARTTPDTTVSVTLTTTTELKTRTSYRQSSATTEPPAAATLISVRRRHDSRDDVTLVDQWLAACPSGSKRLVRLEVVRQLQQCLGHKMNANSKYSSGGKQRKTTTAVLLKSTRRPLIATTVAVPSSTTHAYNEYDDCCVDGEAVATSKPTTSSPSTAASTSGMPIIVPIRPYDQIGGNRRGDEDERGLSGWAHYNNRSAKMDSSFLSATDLATDADDYFDEMYNLTETDDGDRNRIVIYDLTADVSKEQNRPPEVPAVSTSYVDSDESVKDSFDGVGINFNTTTAVATAALQHTSGFARESSGGSDVQPTSIMLASITTSASVLSLITSLAARSSFLRPSSTLAPVKANSSTSLQEGQVRHVSKSEGGELVSYKPEAEHPYRHNVLDGDQAVFDPIESDNIVDDTELPEEDEYETLSSTAFRKVKTSISTWLIVAIVTSSAVLIALVALLVVYRSSRHGSNSQGNATSSGLGCSGGLCRIRERAFRLVSGTSAAVARTPTSVVPTTHSTATDNFSATSDTAGTGAVPFAYGGVSTAAAAAGNLSRQRQKIVDRDDSPVPPSGELKHTRTFDSPQLQHQNRLLQGIVNNGNASTDTSRKGVVEWYV